MTIPSPRHAPAHVPALALLLLALTGCAGLEPAPGKDHLHPMTRQCVEAKTGAAQRCLDALHHAARLRKRRDAGQALLALSSMLGTQKERDALARTALWLEPHPWLGAGSRWDRSALEKLLPDDAGAKVKELRFGVKGGLPTLPALPGVSAEALALTVAAGADAEVVRWRVDGAEVLLPAAPLIAQHVSFAPRFRLAAKRGRDMARAITQADRAIATGDLAEGRFWLKAARDALPEDGHGCADHAALHYASFTFDGLALGEVDAKKLREQLASTCTTRKDQPAALVTWFHLLTTTQLAEVTAENLPAKQKLWASLKNDRRLTPAQRGLLGAALAAKLMGHAVTQKHRANATCGAPPAQPYDMAKLKTVIAGFEGAGRDDLALPWRAHLAMRGGDLTQAAVTGWTDMARAKDRPWLTLKALRTGLTYLPPKLDPLDRVKLAPLCAAYHQTLQRAIGQHRRSGQEAALAKLLMDPSLVTASCPSPLRTETLAEAAIRTVTAEGRPRMDLVRFLGVFTGQSVVALLRGQTQQVLRVLQAMRPTLEAIKRSDAPEDQVAGVVIDTMSALGTADPKRVGMAVLKNRAVLERVLKSRPGKDDPELLRLAPTLRIVNDTLYLVVSLVANKTNATVIPAIVSKTLNEDVRDALRYLALSTDMASDVADRVRVVHAAIAAGVHNTSGTRAQLVQALGRAVNSAPRGPQKAWWGIGAHAVDTIGWSALGYFANAKGASAQRNAAITGGESALRALAEGAITDMKLAHTRWEMLRMLPVVYTVGAEIILHPDGAQAKRVAAQLKRARGKIERLSKEIVAKIKKEGQTPNATPDLVVMLTDALEVVVELGFDRLYDAKAGAPVKGALAKLASAFQAKTTAYPPALKVYAWSAIAALHYNNPQEAHAALRRAEDEARKTAQATSMIYIPLMFSRLVQEDAKAKDHGAALLATLDRVRAFTTRAHGDTCLGRESRATLHALRGRALARAGKHAEALKAHETFLRKLDEGLAGEVRVSCLMQAARGHARANLTLASPIGQIALGDEDGDDAAKSTFQIGVGWTSQEETFQKISCDLQPTTEGLPLRRINAHLFSALNALTIADSASASVHLDALAFQLNRLLRASPATQGREAQAWIKTRGQLSIDALAATVTLARARGHVQVAADLDNALASLRAYARGSNKKQDSMTDDMTLRGTPAWAALIPVVRALYPAKGAVNYDAAEKAVRGSKSALLSAQGKVVLLAAVMMRDGQMDRGRGVISRASAKRATPSERFGLLAMDMFLNNGAVTGKNIEAALKLALDAKLYGEAHDLIFALGGAKRVGWSGAEQTAWRERVRQSIPMHGMPRTELREVSRELGRRSMRNPHRHAAALERYIKLSEGMVPVQNRIGMRQRLMMLRFGTGALDKAARQNQLLLTELTTLAPLNHPLVLKFMTTRLALDAAQGKHDPTRAAEVRRFAVGVKGLPQPIAQALVALSGPLSKRQARSIFMQVVR